MARQHTVTRTERVARWLLLGTLVLGWYDVGTVWLVQITVYPLWARVGQDEFEGYHLAWWHSIWGVILGPAALTVLGSLALLRWRPPRVPAWTLWLGAALQAATYAGTAVWWGPLQARIHDTTGPAYRQLLTTHWLRVALITAYAILVCGMAAASLAGEERGVGEPAAQGRASAAPAARL